MSSAFDSRVGAYAVIVRDQHVLLTHWNPRRPGFDGAWTLPGGGMEPGEQAQGAALREVFEETGYTVELDELLGVHSRWSTPDQQPGGRSRGFHAFRVLYTAHVVAGDLAVEQDGSSDDSRWFPLAEVKELERLDLVDAALRLAGLGGEVADPDTSPYRGAEEEDEQ